MADEPVAPGIVMEPRPNLPPGNFADILASKLAASMPGAAPAAPAPAPTPQPAPAGPLAAVLDPTALMAQALGRRTPAPAEPAAPAPAAVDSLPEAPPAPGDPKANHVWAGLRKQAKDAEAFKAKVAEAEKKLADQQAEYDRKLSELAKTLEEKDTKVKTFEEKLGRVSLAESPEFQERYVAEFNRLRTSMANTLERYAGVEKKDAAALAAQILEAEPRDVAKMVKDLDPGVAGSIISQSANAVALLEKREQELDAWRETQATITHESARTGMIATVQERRAMADAALQQARSEGLVVYDTENPDLAGVATQLSDEFRGFVQSAKPEDLMRLAAMGHALPKYQETLNWYAERNAQLEAVIRARGFAGDIPVGPVAHVEPPSAPNPLEAAKDIRDPNAFAEAALGNMAQRFLGQFRR